MTKDEWDKVIATLPPLSGGKFQSGAFVGRQGSKTQAMKDAAEIQHQLNEMQEFMIQHQTLSSVIEEPEGTYKFLCEYIGSCRSHPYEAQARSVICKDCGGSGLCATRHKLSHITNNCFTCNGQGRVVSTEGAAYASGWVDGGWNVRFPEVVLRAYFPPPAPAFDGDFMRALHASSDMRSLYRKFAYEYHPDRPGGGNQRMFAQLSEAYQALRDPMMRRRYEAGLKFQQQTKQIEKEVLFRVPLSCGDVCVSGEWQETGKWQEPYWMNNKGTYGSVSRRPEEKRLNVTEILSWNPRVRADGMVMVATRSGGSDKSAKFYQDQHGMKPFTVSWEPQFEVNFEVAV